SLKPTNFRRSGMSSASGRGDIELIIRQVAFRDTAVVDDNLAWRTEQLDSRGSRGFRAHLDPFRDLAAFKSNSERNFCPRIAKVFQRDGNHLYSLFRLPWMHRLHVEVRQAAILVHPVVEEPAQVALGNRSDQLLYILWVFVV